MPRARSRAGFSLTEVATALAVAVFALVGLLALVPAGLGHFRHAMDTTLTAQIAQRIVAEAQQTEFTLLVNPELDATSVSSAEFFLMPTRYFDDAGNELPAAEKKRAIFHVLTRVSRPGAADPRTSPPEWFTSLPSSGRRFNPRGMTILTVQVVRNPTGRTVPLTESLLVAVGDAKASGLASQNFTAVVTRNGR